LVGNVEVEKKGLVDLHFHSAYSDGSEGIPSIVEEAKKQGVVALALTDHNNGIGTEEFMAACKEADIVALEGTEIYASFSENSWSWNPDYCGPVPDVVILGRELNWKKFEKYREMLVEYQSGYWLSETLKRLRAAGLKVPTLTREEMRLQFENTGFPRILHDVPKDFDNWPRIWEICHEFDSKIKMEDISQNPVRWANRHLYAIGKQAYVLRCPEYFTVEAAVNLAEAMGGILFAAHPGGDYANWSDKHLDLFVEQGGKGIEVYQYWHTEAQIKKFLNYAKEHNLLISGGSDWHGKNGRPTLGCWDKPSVQMPLKAFKKLLQQLP